MRLTPELVGLVPPVPKDRPRPPATAGRRLATDDDRVELVHEIVSAAPADGEVWIFGYGSLIWNPGFAYDERRVGTLKGWRRAFCLGWDTWFRGCAERPGLMLSLDRGGQCRGVAFRLPRASASEHLMMLMRREVHFLPHPFPPRWVTVETASGSLRAVTFVIDRGSDAYVGGTTIEGLADMLASAAGEWGSMAEYLHSTVSHLEAEGIRDSHLWLLQEMVAERLEERRAASAI
jgi:glutathione-specific gamma-glutamylcyclotransferase